MESILRALMLLLAMLAPPACAADLSQERSVKAAFLSKFIDFVELEESSAPIIIGVIRADDIAAELKRIMAGRPLTLRPVQIRTLHIDESLAGVHMLFVGGDQSDRTEQVLNAASHQGTLTVTEVDSGLRLGSMINFRRIDERVRFEVSLPAAQKSNVKLSARLLSVAYHVLKER